MAKTAKKSVNPPGFFNLGRKGFLGGGRLGVGDSSQERPGNKKREKKIIGTYNLRHVLKNIKLFGPFTPHQKNKWEGPG